MQINRGHYNAYAPLRMKKAGLEAPKGEQAPSAPQPANERAQREPAGRKRPRAGSR